MLSVEVDRPTLRIHGWSSRITASATAASAFRQGYHALNVLAPGLPDGRHLIHSDLLNRNVLVGADDLTAVLDWGSALYGDFLFDVAWLWFWAPWSAGSSAVDLRHEAARHFEATGGLPQGFEARCGRARSTSGLTA